jgi:DNA (cytosine-5)-methyltransferase 1
MTRPRLLDLFAGAGGAAVGYHRAGFEVVGVDIAPQPRFPFEFHQAHAVEYVMEHGAEFDVITASPPCKVATSLKWFSERYGTEHLDMIPATRMALRHFGKPYVIENVVGARLRGPIMLCGSSFDLGVQRHRLFESNLPLDSLPCDHKGQAERSPGYPVKRYHSGKPVITMSPVIGVFGRGQGLGPGEVELWKQAMGIDWMTRDEMAQAIPPAYTEYIGEQLMEHLLSESAA